MHDRIDGKTRIMSLTPSTMLPLGTRAPDFHLPDTDGKIMTLDDFRTAPALLVVFLCNHCPYVKHIRHQLATLAKDYQEKGVAVVGINSNDAVNYPGRPSGDDGPGESRDRIHVPLSLRRNPGSGLRLTRPPARRISTSSTTVRSLPIGGSWTVAGPVTRFPPRQGPQGGTGRTARRPSGRRRPAAQPWLQYQVETRQCTGICVREMQ